MMILYTDGDVTEGNQRGLISPFVWSERQASLLDIGPLHLEAYAVPRLLLSIDLHRLSFEWLKSKAMPTTRRSVMSMSQRRLGNRRLPRTPLASPGASQHG